ncbi:hypothetical protein CKA32_003672 [Geitlerinema sp. FC II]|nr:hypothetical protein CKA32_003672 [Geitlerinema sp. FC II]
MIFLICHSSHKNLDRSRSTLVKERIEKICFFRSYHVKNYQKSKDSGKTSYIERFNNTLRQRVSRFVRKTLSFSKKLENHVGAIWDFVHHYNASIRARHHHCA